MEPVILVIEKSVKSGTFMTETESYLSEDKKVNIPGRCRLCHVFLL